MILRHNVAKNTWLILSLIFVALMILWGGFTRLTDSGLSIVEWKPVTGILPPLSIQDWQSEFDKYKLTPEYDQHNSNMDLNSFRFIFWVEFIHRLLGRITGLIFIIPLIYFYLKNQIDQQSKSSYFLITILFGVQGFMGWYMVKSGLVNEPSVSHFRLANHLIIAFFIYSLVFWQLLKNSANLLIIAPTINLKNLRLHCYIATILAFVQVYLGGLVAGLDAGQVYNNFPLMGDSFIPFEIYSNESMLKSFHDPVFIQFLHRINAYLLTLAIISAFIISYKLGNKQLIKLTLNIVAAISLQMTLGVFTLIYQVPLILGLLHQLGGIILISTLLLALYSLKKM